MISVTTVRKGPLGRAAHVNAPTVARLRICPQNLPPPPPYPRIANSAKTGRQKKGQKQTAQNVRKRAEKSENDRKRPKKCENDGKQAKTGVNKRKQAKKCENWRKAVKTIAVLLLLVAWPVSSGEMAVAI